MPHRPFHLLGWEDPPPYAFGPHNPWRGGDLTAANAARSERALAAASSPVKVCFTCKREFPRTLEYFYSHPVNVDGLQGKCKSCAKATSAAVRESHDDNPGTKQRYATAMKISREDMTLLVEYRDLISGDPCYLCGAPGEVYDHVVPLARGGEHQWWNQARACTSCNTSKRATPLLLFMLGRSDGILGVARPFAAT